MARRDPASDQLVNLQKSSNNDPNIITTKTVAPVGVKTAIETVGKNGPALLQDVSFLDEISAFDRERIPERVVHAKGAGAFGNFKVTHDITKYCAAKIFESIGKETPLAVRFSTTVGESGSADTVRDVRGFAIKFYTDDGNWDLVGINSPIFFIRDPTLFPSLVHSHKRNPVTYLKDADMSWDFITLRPETTHALLLMFSDRGIPDGYRHMNGYGAHTFQLVNKNGISHWAKFHYETNQGIQNLPVKTANELLGSEPDYSIRDLYNAIAKGDHPSWTLCIQVMTMEQAAQCNFNPFDLTKVWPHEEYPLIPVGTITLNRNPNNYFADVEQIAFSPANLVPGIEPSPDKMLQGRLFAYSDTNRYRLGANFLQIPINCPYRVTVSNYQRDGPQNVTDNQDGRPNYFPNSFSGPLECERAKNLQPHHFIEGEEGRYDSGSEDNFSQATIFWTTVLDDAAKARLVENIVESLTAAAAFIQERAVNNFLMVHPDLGNQVADGIKSQMKGVHKRVK